MPRRDVESRRAYDRTQAAKRRALQKESTTLYNRSFRLKSIYGLELDDYHVVLQKQGGVCAICKSAETKIGSNGKVQGLSIDHCHSTGVIRGLLCASCNTLLGYCKDNVNTLRAAAIYLETADTGYRVDVPPSAEDFLKEMDKL